jgi:hypothetical protein
LYVIFVKAVLIHLVWLSVPTAEDKIDVVFGFTVIVPVAVLAEQPPVKVIV